MIQKFIKTNKIQVFLQNTYEWYFIYVLGGHGEVQGPLVLPPLPSHEVDQMGSEALDLLWEWDCPHCKLSSLHWQGPVESGAWPWLLSLHGHGRDAAQDQCLGILQHLLHQCAPDEEPEAAGDSGMLYCPCQQKGPDDELPRHEEVDQQDDLVFVNWQDTKFVCVLSNYHDPADCDILPAGINRANMTKSVWSCQSSWLTTEVHKGSWPQQPNDAILFGSDGDQSSFTTWWWVSIMLSSSPSSSLVRLLTRRPGQISRSSWRTLPELFLLVMCPAIQCLTTRSNGI